MNKGAELIFMKNIKEIAPVICHFCKEGHCISIRLKSDGPVYPTSNDKVLITQWLEEILEGYRSYYEIMSHRKTKRLIKYTASLRPLVILRCPIRLRPMRIWNPNAFTVLSQSAVVSQLEHNKNPSIPSVSHPAETPPKSLASVTNNPSTTSSPIQQIADVPPSTSKPSSILQSSANPQSPSITSRAKRWKMTVATKASNQIR